MLTDSSPSTLIGNKLMLAFVGMEAPPPYILERLAARPLGGFSLFRIFNFTTPAQVRSLTNLLQSTAQKAGHPPLLIAADQEGGQLMALGRPMTQFPGNMALAATQDLALARQVGEATGREMAALGINVNYAPVCDINTNPANPALGIRTFGEDPTLAGQMAHALITGMQATGVAATAKHFPGIGDVGLDSHHQLPVIEHTRDRLESMELTPFRLAIRGGVKMVMSAHLAIPALAGNRELPATLSPLVMTDLLRGELGFNGVTITDALDMGAITQGAGQIVDTIAAVRAGVDLLLVMTDRATQEQIEGGLNLAYSRGLFDDADLRTSVERILALKTWIARHTQPDLDVVGCADHQALALSVATQAITLVRDDAGLLPLRLPTEARIAAVLPQPQDLTPADTSSYEHPSLGAALQNYHPLVTEYITGHSPTEDEITAVRQQAANSDLIVLGTISASLNPHQQSLAHALLGLDVPVITVALRTPYDLAFYPESQTHLCTYSIQQQALDALTAALWGEVPIGGRLPTAIATLYPAGHGINKP